MPNSPVRPERRPPSHGREREQDLCAKGPSRASARGGPVRAVSLGLALAATALVAPSCKSKTRPPSGQEVNAPARRAAVSFVHCIELEGATCVGFDEAQSAWDAFSLLGWLASGSPTSILDALQRELYHHSNPRSIQSRFVTHVERNAAKIRGAECRPVMPGNDADAQRVVIGFAQLIPSLRSTVQARLEAMDLWRGDVARVVDGLTEEAMRGLSDGFLVAMRCESEPHQVYVATARRGEAYVAVGFVTRLPEFLGGTGAARDARSGRLVPINVGESGSQFGVVPEGLVHPWVPVPVEEF